MADVIVFHPRPGLTDGVGEFADRLLSFPGGVG
jgi:hypothetical protein